MNDDIIFLVNRQPSIEEREFIVKKNGRRLLYFSYFALLFVLIVLCYFNNGNVNTILGIVFSILLFMIFPYIQYKAKVIKYTCFYIIEIKITNSEIVVRYFDQEDNLNEVRRGLMECELKFMKFDVIFDAIGKGLLLFYDFRESRSEPSLFQFELLDWNEEKMNEVVSNFQFRKNQMINNSRNIQ